MTYFDEIRHRSILLWRSLFNAAEDAAGDAPVDIDAPAAGGYGLPAAGGDISVRSRADGPAPEDGALPGSGPLPAEEVAAAVSGRAPRKTGASDRLRALRRRGRPDPSAAETADGAGEPEETCAAAAAEGTSEDGTADAARPEQVLRGVEEAAGGGQFPAAALRSRTAAQEGREDARRSALERQRAAAETGQVLRETVRAAGRRRDTASFTLRAAVRRTERAAAAASSPADGTARSTGAFPAQTSAPADAGDWSMVVERDARRYDGSCDTM